MAKLLSTSRLPTGLPMRLYELANGYTVSIMFGHITPGTAQVIRMLDPLPPFSKKDWGPEIMALIPDPPPPPKAKAGKRNNCRVRTK
jgi:hypothetical protein